MWLDIMRGGDGPAQLTRHWIGIAIQVEIGWL
jgi:hypothetical protein